MWLGFLSGRRVHSYCITVNDNVSKYFQVSFKQNKFQFLAFVLSLHSPDIMWTETHCSVTTKHLRPSCRGWWLSTWLRTTRWHLLVWIHLTRHNNWHTQCCFIHFIEVSLLTWFFSCRSRIHQTTFRCCPTLRPITSSASFLLFRPHRTHYLRSSLWCR